MPNEKDTTPKIMTKPLPEILDELEEYIQQVEKAVKEAREAAAESQAAASEARAAGQEAAAAARKAAEAAVAKVVQEAEDTFAAIRAEMVTIKKTAQDALKLAQAMNVGIAEGTKAYNREIEPLS